MIPFILVKSIRLCPIITQFIFFHKITIDKTIRILLTHLINVINASSIFRATSFICLFIASPGECSVNIQEFFRKQRVFFNRQIT